ncbi:hypothetical protein [Minwuia thermotolerans]|uniref:hypothetical protein n=1 Tax=Minwuia thermotolerans TaxID=2056226 RepID=UPI0013DDFDF2|nr:hypothetical protein [Minwuia thermotolerans]
MSGNAASGGEEKLWLVYAVVSFGGRNEVLATLKRDRKVKSLQPVPAAQDPGVVEW